MTGLPNRANSPSSSMARAPSVVSSAGWPMNISVPFHWLFIAAICWAAPIQAAMWMSWPQLWSTGVGLPR